MKIIEYIKYLSRKLFTLYDENEAESVSFYFVEEISGWDKNYILTHQDQELTSELLEIFKQGEKRLLKGEPVQYVTGISWFYGLKFFVNKSVLIPRQETEILVDFIIKRHKESGVINILDIGTGSGCIPISLKKFLPLAEVFSLDVSEEALKVCNINSANNSVQIYTEKYDILGKEEFPFDFDFDIIISNPPYVLNSEKKDMHKNVVDYEPEQALYVDDSHPLIFYSNILDKIKAHVTKNTELVFEINEKFAKEIIDLNLQFGFINNTIIEDLNYKQRFVFSTQ